MSAQQQGRHQPAESTLLASPAMRRAARAPARPAIPAPTASPHPLRPHMQAENQALKEQLAAKDAEVEALRQQLQGQDAAPKFDRRYVQYGVAQRAAVCALLGRGVHAVVP